MAKNRKQRDGTHLSMELDDGLTSTGVDCDYTAATTVQIGQQQPTGDVAKLPTMMGAIAPVCAVSQFNDMAKNINLAQPPAYRKYRTHVDLRYVVQSAKH